MNSVVRKAATTTPYCQDNETSWYDWSYLEEHKEIFQFTRSVIAFRTAHPILSKEKFYTDAEIRWFSPQQQLPNWFDPKEKQLACLIQEGEQCAIFLMFNAGSDAVDFGLPSAPLGARWHLAVDTSPEALEGLFAAGDEPLCEDPFTFHLSSRSSAVLIARQAEIK